MTAGNPMRLVLGFAVPLIFGNLLQQLYALVDATIVGRFVGVNAFAAIGSTNWPIWWLGTIPRDFSNAFSIVASISIGKRDHEEFRRILAQAVCCAGALTLAVTGALLAALDPLLHLLSVSSAVYADARTYLAIMVLCLPFSMTFQMTSGLLRAAGNGSITFVAMAASTVLNIALDLVFVLELGWAVTGVGVATWLSQGLSMAIVLVAASQNALFRTRRAHWRFDGALVAAAVKLWLPMAMNSLIITGGGLVVQRKVNAIGAHFTAGFEAGSKIYNLFESVIVALQAGTCVFVGQNLGAGQPRRIRSGMHRMVLVALLATAAMIGLVWLWGDKMVLLFLSKQDPALFESARTVGLRYALVLSTGMVAMTPMYMYRMSLQALGHPNYTILAGLLQLVARTVTALLLTLLWGETALYFTEAMAWATSLPAVLIPFEVYVARLCRQTPEAGQEAAATGTP